MRLCLQGRPSRLPPCPSTTWAEELSRGLEVSVPSHTRYKKAMTRGLHIHVHGIGPKPAAGHPLRECRTRSGVSSWVPSGTAPAQSRVIVRSWLWPTGCTCRRMPCYRWRDTLPHEAGTRLLCSQTPHPSCSAKTWCMQISAEVALTTPLSPCAYEVTTLPLSANARTECHCLSAP